MMRTDTEFRDEIVRRKSEVLRRRRRAGAALSSAALCSVLLGVLFLLPPSADRNAGEKAPETGDVTVYIYVGSQTLTDSDDVGPRMEALSKYVPLPEADGDCYDAGFSEDDRSSDPGISPGGSVDFPNTGVFPGERNDSSDAAAESATDNALVSSGLSGGRACSFTVSVGSVSKTYCLKEYSVTVDQTEYLLTEAQFDELWSLFGEEG